MVDRSMVDPTRGLAAGCSPTIVQSGRERIPAFHSSPGVLIVSAVVQETVHMLRRPDIITHELANGRQAVGRGEEPEPVLNRRSSWLLEPTRLETTPEELKKALKKYKTIVTSLVATP